MQISNSNSLNFNANIRFVDSKKFAKIASENYFYCANPLSPIKNSMMTGQRFWTSEVKSCTAGGIVGKEEAIGFHIYDCQSNVKEVAKSFLKTIKEKITDPVSALILGSKDIPSAPDSIPVYEVVAKQTKKIVNPSEFKTYSVKYAEADVAYEKATDTWFINASYPENPMIPKKRIEIESVDDLKSMFKSIKIAPQDKLFIGEKEVLLNEHPELFLREL